MFKVSVYRNNIEMGFIFSADITSCSYIGGCPVFTLPVFPVKKGDVILIAQSYTADDTSKTWLYQAKIIY